MTAPDFEVILAVAMTSTEFSGRTIYSPPRAASSALAAKVPELCPTCGGSGRGEIVYGGQYGVGSFDSPVCPDCPTIGALLAEATEARQLAQKHGAAPAKLLAIGAAVMGAELERCEWVALETDGDLTRIAGTLLNRLRAVQP